MSVVIEIVIFQNKFISVLDFKDNPLRIFATHELASIIDPAMSTKMTVQFNLFGGTVLKLGTERHHSALLSGIDSLDDVGCFGLTELGYGNNAVEMETTAVYDQVYNLKYKGMVMPVVIQCSYSACTKQSFIYLSVEVASHSTLATKCVTVDSQLFCQQI